jgi:hypothetical protein
MFKTCLATTLVLFGSPEGTAPHPTPGAQWHAKQVQRDKLNGSGRETDLYYAHDRLRIDNPDHTSLIVEFEAGAFTFINHRRKTFARASAEELLDVRGAMLTEMKKELPNLPEAIQKKVRQQIEELEKQGQSPVKPRKTGKLRTVRGFKCEVYEWESERAFGQACIAKNLPVDIRPFQASAEKLGKRMASLESEASNASLALLRLAKHGFPVQTIYRQSKADSKNESSTEITKITKETIDIARFSVPEAYQSLTFQAFLGG